MIVFKGDEVRLKSGETAEIIETWGVARVWCKLKTSDGKTIFAKVEQIESISRSSKKVRTTDRSSAVTPAMKGDNQITLF